MNTWE